MSNKQTKETNNTITKEELRNFKAFKNFSDQEAAERIKDYENFADMIFVCFQNHISKSKEL